MSSQEFYKLIEELGYKVNSRISYYEDMFSIIYQMAQKLKQLEQKHD